MASAPARRKASIRGFSIQGMYTKCFVACLHLAAFSQASPPLLPLQVAIDSWLDTAVSMRRAPGVECGSSVLTGSSCIGHYIQQLLYSKPPIAAKLCAV